MIPESITHEFDQCIKCGLCMAACPVGKELFLEKYTPRGKVQLAKAYAAGNLGISDHFRDIFAKCLLCGACSVTCPSGVGLTEVLVGMREEITREEGIHPKMAPAMESLLVNHNISDEDNSERGDWRDDISAIPEHFYEKERADLVYFVGCVSSFFPMVQSIPRNMVRILEAALVGFTILAGEEWCCGFPLIGAGEPGKMGELIRHNLEQVKGLGAKRVVFSCPSCYRTWSEYYNTDLELLHSTQFIRDLLRDGSLSLKTVNTTVTYHDPCDLGRNGGEFDAPRKVLGAIPGLTLVELENNRAVSVCCGGGGNVEMADPGLSGKIAGDKVAQIRQTGAGTVVTSCQQCIRTIKGRVRRERADLEVLDITDLVLRAMSDA